jgi:hypothetical protein
MCVRPRQILLICHELVIDFQFQTVYSIRNPHQDRTVRLIKWWKAQSETDFFTTINTKMVVHFLTPIVTRDRTRQEKREIYDTKSWQNASREVCNFWHPNRTRTKTNRDSTRINVQFLTRIHTSIIVPVSGARTCLSPCFTAPYLTNLKI